MTEENSRTVEITEYELRAITNCFTGFLEMTRFRAQGLDPGEAAAIANQTNHIDAFLAKCTHAFKHNRPVRKSSIIALDGGRF